MRTRAQEWAITYNKLAAMYGKKQSEEQCMYWLEELEGFSTRQLQKVCGDWARSEDFFPKLSSLLRILQNESKLSYGCDCAQARGP